MLVALAVTVIALAVVTNVFTVTTKTAAKSAAIAEVEQLARNFADQLTQDLKHCDPSRSILVLVGRKQAAALTQDQLDAGQYYRVLTGDPNYVPPDYDSRFDGSGPAQPGGTNARDQFSDPRADILMFFTNRPSASKAPAINPDTAFQDKLQQGMKVSPIQVVYGHAAIDTAVQSGGEWEFAGDLQHIETDDPAHDLSPLPAVRWHLSRRAVLLAPNTGASGFMDNSGFGERIVRCYSESADYAGDSAPLNIDDYVELFAPYYEASASRWYGRALRSPYQFWGGQLGWTAGERGLIWNVLYSSALPDDHHVATVIEQPPAELASNLGVHLVPGCVWFQVEFLMPEDPRNSLDHPLADQRRETPRWVEVEHDQTYVFVPDTDENRALVESQVYMSGPRAGRALPHPNRLREYAQVIPPGMARDMGMLHEGDTAQNRRVRMWPYAIRVTVRVIDQRGRLNEPIARSVVHRFE